MKGESTLILCSILLAFLFLVPFSSAESDSTIREECLDHETAVMGFTEEVEDEEGYGSHVFDHSEVDTDRVMCFDEILENYEQYGSFESGFAEDDCGELVGDGWNPILDLHRPGFTDGSEGELGSHVDGEIPLCDSYG